MTDGNEHDTPGGLAVELTGIGKRFPGVIANYDIDLKVRRGTIHAIVGENGAGKSTLMKTLYGMHQPDSGTITVNGEVHQFKSPSEAIATGIGMVHQHFMLADNLTVLENIILGAEPAKGVRIDFEAAHKKVLALAKAVGTTVNVDAPVSDLGVGQRQRVEILKVLYRGANILILDEPTAVLVPQEVDELFITLRHLVDDGATVIFISHKLDEVLAVSDEITVIRQGTTVTSVLPKDTDRRQLAELMVGSQLPSPEGRNSEISSDVRLSVSNLTVKAPGQRDLVHDATLTVRASEIVGIAGVEGNGQFELCTAILGLLPSSGVVKVGGEDVSRSSTHHRRNAGLAYIPFDRHREGLMSTPRVGWAASSTLGSLVSSRPTSSFCWFPPESAKAGTISLGVSTSKRSMISRQSALAAFVSISGPLLSSAACSRPRRLFSQSGESSISPSRCRSNGM